MIIQCRREMCKYEWDYNGLGEFQAFCPRCNHKNFLHRTPEEIVLLRQLKEELKKEEEEKDANLSGKESPI